MTVQELRVLLDDQPKRAVVHLRLNDNSLIEIHGDRIWIRPETVYYKTYRRRNLAKAARARRRTLLKKRKEMEKEKEKGNATRKKQTV